MQNDVNSEDTAAELLDQIISESLDDRSKDIIKLRMPASSEKPKG